MNSQIKKFLYFVQIFTIFFVQTFYSINRFDPRLISEQELLQLVEESKKDDDALLNYKNNDNSSETTITRKAHPIKPLTIMIYIAADNDLHYFAWKNIKQMELIGSNENINIVIQLNTPGYLNYTKRYIVQKGQRLLIQEQEQPLKEKVNSGSPYSLIDFADWSVSNFPASDYVLVCWNHGTGGVDPTPIRTINPCELFYCNPSNNMLEIDRGLSYLSLILQIAKEERITPKRGICFDETFKSYISNQELEFALSEICTKVLKGKKLSIIAFDACLMSMIEIASAAKKYADYMVGSQEVEFGTGWDYELALKPFLTQRLTPYDFAKHIVSSYEQAYCKITNEYTQSALDLKLCQALETNISKVSDLLLDAFANSNYVQTANILRKCKSTQYCTCFDEPSYIDLDHFYRNLLQHLQYFNINDQNKKIVFQENLKNALLEGLKIINSFVIANKVGSRLKDAKGISIYFPERTLIKSYLKTSFASNNSWSKLLSKYIYG